MRINRHFGVESSNIRSLGYEPARRVLEVNFLKGQTYRYYNVPADEYCKLLNALSVGSHFSKFVAKSFTYEKMPADVN